MPGHVADYLPEEQLAYIRAHTSPITGAYAYGLMHSPLRQLSASARHAFMR